MANKIRQMMLIHQTPRPIFIPVAECKLSKVCHHTKCCSHESNIHRLIAFLIWCRLQCLHSTYSLPEVPDDDHLSRKEDEYQYSQKKFFFRGQILC